MQTARFTICFFLCPFVLGNAQGIAQQFPPSAEGIVSDARGFGALKLLCESEAIQARFSIDTTLEKELKLLLGQAIKRLEAFPVRRGSRVTFIEPLDRFLEPEIEKMFGKEAFQEFSRAVIRQRRSESVARGRSLIAFLYLPGVANYVGCEPQLSTLTLKSREYELNKGNSFRMRIEFLAQASEELSLRASDRLRDVLGEEVVSNPRNRQSPASSEPFRFPIPNSGSSLVSALSSTNIKDSIGGDESLAAQAQELAAEIRSEATQLRHEELRLARKEGRAPEMRRITSEMDAKLVKSIHLILTEKQERLLSQYFARSFAGGSLTRFISAPGVKEYLDSPNEYQQLMSHCQKLEREILLKNREFRQKSTDAFIASLSPEVLRRLEALVDPKEWKDQPRSTK
ncbi:MAG: hypothetical protein AAF483_04995 [Planctomycetota bacterium]